MAKEKSLKANKKARIYTIFLSSGHPVGFEAYQKYHPDIKVMKNQEILERVKDECKGIEFSGKAEPVKTEEAILNVKERKGGLYNGNRSTKTY